LPGRVDVLDTARRMRRDGLAVASTGNVSAREDDHVHVTPSGLPYEDMETEDIVTLTLAGEVLRGDRPPSSERLVHLAVYRAMPDVGGVVHTHSPHAVAWSFRGEELDTRSEELDIYAGGAVRTAPYTATGSQDLAEAALAALEGRRAVLLARHGVLAVGGTPQQALDTAHVVERQAQVALLLRP